MSARKSNARITWIDALRVFALVCIIITHTLRHRIEPVTLVALMMVIGSAVLFFMASGALVLPLKQPAWPWLKRRLIAVGVPMVIWSVFYIYIYDLLGVTDHLDGNDKWVRWVSILWAQRGNLWFLNALIGLYLVVPLISPWIEKASKRSVEIFLFLWLLTGFYPYLRSFYGIGYGQPAQLSIIGGLYGFFGYFIMGYYFVRWPVQKRSAKDNIFVLGVLLAFSAVGVVLFDPSVRNDLMYDLLDDLNCNNMAWFTLIFVAFSLIPQLAGIAGKIVSALGKSVYGAFLSTSFVQAVIVDPYIADPALACVVCVILSFAIGLALKHIPVVGKYLC